MAKEDTISNGSFWAQLFQLKLYKKTQGRVTRQATFAAIAIVFCLAAYRFDIWTSAAIKEATMSSSVRRLITLGIAVVGVGLAYRIVNYSRFADFLISVEAEMTKVSWPTRMELVRSSMVVIVVMFTMASVLAIYDIVWLRLLQFLGIRL